MVWISRVWWINGGSYYYKVFVIFVVLSYCGKIFRKNDFCRIIMVWLMIDYLFSVNFNSFYNKF